MEQIRFPRLVCSWRKEKRKEDGKVTRVIYNLKYSIKTGEMTCLLRALASLSEELGLVPSADMVTYNCL